MVSAAIDPAAEEAHRPRDPAPEQDRPEAETAGAGQAAERPAIPDQQLHHRLADEDAPGLGAADDHAADEQPPRRRGVHQNRVHQHDQRLGQDRQPAEEGLSEHNHAGIRG